MRRDVNENNLLTFLTFSLTKPMIVLNYFTRGGGAMVSDVMGKRIKSERERLGLSLEELASELKISRQTLSQIEKGQSVLSSDKLYLLAKKAGRRISFFYEEEAEPIAIFFRADSAEQVDLELENDLKRRLSLYADLEEILDITHVRYIPPARRVKSFSSAGKHLIKDCAKEERARLGIGDAPIKDVFELLSDRGLKIICVDTELEDFYGASAYSQEWGACIFVNTNHRISLERQVFTVAHEYGHLIFHQPQFVKGGIQHYSKGSGRGKAEEEKIVDFFAGNFLVPESYLRKVIPTVKFITPEDVLYAKKIFGVSYKTIIERLAHLKIIKESAKGIFYGRFAKLGIKKDEEPEPMAPEHLGRNRRYEELTRVAYESGLITLSKFAELRHISILEAREKTKEWGKIDGQPAAQGSRSR
jgi:Zn-dependent peptidase ImmA (M78 family)/transcriptional regulator with XRE-family HTH domain